MNKIIFMAFTSKGHDLAKKLETHFRDNAKAYRVSKLTEFIPKVFNQGNFLVFIGAVGIAVRGIAPYLQNKATDPAVIVIDENARFVIPILSGHIGRSNEFAIRIADELNAIPIITTATDINDIFAVDTFAVQNGYAIVEVEKIKDISSYLLEKRDIGLSTEFEIVGDLPPNINFNANSDVGIRISCDISQKPFNKTLHLLPKCFHVGIGSRKNADFDKLNDFFLMILRKNSIPIECVGTISSIELKKNEPAIRRLSEKYQIPYITYVAHDLLPYEHLFNISKFAKKVTGVGNICETSAYISSKKGEIIHFKTAQCGMTIAIAKENWRVIF